jgi:hypothetical protein
MFRTLSATEEAEYVAWAKKAGSEGVTEGVTVVDPLWHPVVQNELLLNGWEEGPECRREKMT